MHRPDLSASARIVQEALSQHGLGCEVVELPQSTRTARDAAAAIGCEVAQIAKSIVFRGETSGRPVLVVASGSNRIDETAVAKVLGESIVKASAEAVREATGFAIGGVPPLGHRQELVTLIDEDLMRYPTVWAAAGTPNAVFSLAPTELPRITGGEVVRLAS